MIITLDDFLDKNICSEIIEHFESIENKERFTDENVECHKFIDKKWYKNIDESLSKVTMLYPPLNLSNEARIIKYKIGDCFRVHTDTPFEICKYRQSPSYRLLIYLSDCEGGETYFPKYNVRVSPKVGRAVLFPLDFAHKGLVVLSNFKYVIAYDVYYSECNKGINIRQLSKNDTKLFGDTKWFSTVYNCYNDILNKNSMFYYRIHENDNLRSSTSNGITKIIFNSAELCLERIDISCDLMFTIKCKNINKFNEFVKISLLNGQNELLYTESQFKIETYENDLHIIYPIVASYPFEPASQQHVLNYCIEYDSNNVELITTQLTSLCTTTISSTHDLHKTLHSYKNLSGPNGMFYRKNFYHLKLSQDADQEELEEIENLKKSQNSKYPILNNLCLYYSD